MRKSTARLCHARGDSSVRRPASDNSHSQSYSMSLRLLSHRYTSKRKHLRKRRPVNLEALRDALNQPIPADLQGFSSDDTNEDVQENQMHADTEKNESKELPAILEDRLAALNHSVSPDFKDFGGYDDDVSEPGKNDIKAKKSRGLAKECQDWKVHPSSKGVKEEMDFELNEDIKTGESKTLATALRAAQGISTAYDLQGISSDGTGDETDLPADANTEESKELPAISKTRASLNHPVRTDRGFGSDGKVSELEKEEDIARPTELKIHPTSKKFEEPHGRRISGADRHDTKDSKVVCATSTVHLNELNHPVLPELRLVAEKWHEVKVSDSKWFQAPYHPSSKKFEGPRGKRLSEADRFTNKELPLNLKFAPFTQERGSELPEGGFRSWGNCDWIMKCAKILKRDLVCSLRGSNLDMLIADIQVFTADRFNPGDRVLAKTNHPASIGCFTLGYIIQQTSADTFHVKFYNGVERKNCERHEIRPLLHPLFPTDISTIAEIDPSPNKLHRNAQDFLWYLNNIDRTGLSLYTLWIRSAVRFTINNEFIRNMHIDKRPNQEHLHSLQQYLLRRRSGIEQEKKMYNLDDGEYLGFFRSDWSTKFLPDQFCLNFKRHLYSWLNYEICEITRRRSQDGPEPKI
ncbi:hypothetical protein AAMO2058_001588300 [Amorphochlora amoebiformis]